MIKSFKEKSDNDSNWINGGFMVVNPSIYQHIKSNNDVLETDLLTIWLKGKSYIVTNITDFGKRWIL